LQFAAADGPVRGNGQIIQELESAFRGAKWNVIKVLWEVSGIRFWSAIRKDCSSNEWANWWTASIKKLVVSSGAYVREHFFGHDPVAEAGRAVAG